MTKRVVVSISVPYEPSNEEYFDSVEGARDYVKNLSPAAYDWDIETVRIYVIAREIDVHELLKEDTSYNLFETAVQNQILTLGQLLDRDDVTICSTAAGVIEDVIDQLRKHP